MTGSTGVRLPLTFDAMGRTSTVVGDDEVRQLVRVLLSTSAGERVMRPDLGGGVDALVFQPAGDDLAGATHLLIQAGLMNYLGDRLDVQRIEVTPGDGTLTVSVSYTTRPLGTPQLTSITVPVGL